MQIIDCFTFYNELDLLTYRLNILNDVVDYFILVEATDTHAGFAKSLFYDKNKHLFEKFKDKIIHIIVDDFAFKHPNIDFTKDNQWENERYQRNCIKKGLDKLRLNKEDIIIIADLDEIPDPNTLLKIKQQNIKLNIIKLELDFYYYNLHSKFQQKWYHTKMINYDKFIELNISCSDIRMRNNIPIITNGGWHLSYFGNSQFIQNKLQQFAHQEFNSDKFTNLEIIQKKIDDCTDLFGRPWENIEKISIKDNLYLPPEYEKYLSKFYTNKVNVSTPVATHVETNAVPNYIYIHVCCINNWKDILGALLYKIKDSLLYDKIKEIRCGIIGDYSSGANLFDDPKIVILYISNNIKLYEINTINSAYEGAEKENCNILYLHTKGVSYNGNNNCVNEWTNYISYFNIYKSDMCINLLKIHDCVGVNMQENMKEKVPLHYSGNFWWATSQYLRKLNKCGRVDENKQDCCLTDKNNHEFWLLSKKIGSYVSLWTSNVNMYHVCYLEDNYKNKEITPVINNYK